MKKIVLLSAVLMLSACGPQVAPVDEGTARAIQQSITYIKDLRTNLCFATIRSGDIGRLNDANASLTNVPCSTEVLALIQQ